MPSPYAMSCDDNHSTGSDSNFFAAERRRFYAFLRAGRALQEARVYARQR